ncbi:MAG: DUF2177 family protein [Candidatus Eisenbacteria bacterium]
MNRVRSYAISATVMLVLDLLWLGAVAPPLYRREVGSLMRAQPDILAAALFYAIYVVGVNEFVLAALRPGDGVARAAARGALFGFVAYATFDLTALAVLNGWTATITAVDMAWGTVLTAIVAAVTHALGAERAERAARAPR